ncbi:hypothetical protein AB0Y20_01600 [Heyndrickxia oleronia]|uniref:hypothetical protein n=1 Tax=Heyndrickxia oleronia TaxID=38875 RepID=UPI003F1FC61A
MLYRNGNQWDLCPYKVRYTQYGEVLEQYTHDKQWWIDFAVQWKHTTILEFIDMKYTNEQKARLEEIKYIPEGYGDICSDYVIDGSFPTDWVDHPLQLIQLRKENEKLKEDVSTLQNNLDQAVMELTTVIAMQGSGI